jgi:hypothetical protein
MPSSATGCPTTTDSSLPNRRALARDQYAAARADEDAKWRELSLSTDLPGLGNFSQTAVGQMVRTPHTS